MSAGHFVEAQRFLYLTTPLGADKLLLRSFSGHEGISQLFHFQLELSSEDPAIDFGSIIGQKLTFGVRLLDKDKVRYFNGHVSRFAQLPGDGRLAHYQAEIVPWLWFLSRTADCKIFQHQTVPDIIQSVFKTFGFTDYELRLQGAHRTWDYCVQYRETALNFVMRLMEQEGIFFFFKQEDGKHTLVLGDSPPAHKPCPDQATFRYEKSFAADESWDEDVIFAWRAEQEIRPGKYAMTDYNFETPSTSLLAQMDSHVQVGGNSNFEVFDYPGEFGKRDEGDRSVRVRLEEDEACFTILSGESNCRSMIAGFKFNLGDHPRADQNAAYVLTSVAHSAEEGGFYSGEGSPTEGRYRNSFTATPASVPFRAPRVTPRPIVQGTQTAVVVGPPGEEIYTDKYGRVKVQFHWDRYGKRNENSSCWVRVSHPWAGKSWGAISIPRVGQEVVVDFLEGDPDHPLIVGRVYNAEQMPPYGLPAGGVVSGIKSNSTKGGGGYNEISMDDTKGKERVTIHAQYDMDTSVLHDDYQAVGRDRHIVIVGEQRQYIDKAHSFAVKGEHKQYCDSKYSLKVKGDAFHDFLNNHKLAVTNELFVQAKSVIVQGGQEVTIQGPGCFIKLDASGVTIQGVMVRINSGGMPGVSAITGKGSEPDQPKEPPE